MRATAFLVNAGKAGGGIWERLFSEPAEISLVRPKEGIRQEEGPFGGGKLIITSRSLPARIDLIYAFEMAATEEFSTLGTFQSSNYEFLKLVNRYLDESEEISRLAFGAVLLRQAVSKEGGYKSISSCLPDITLDCANSQDFLYQINRPRLIELQGTGLLVNRLSKWAVARIQRLQIEVNIGEKTSHTVPSLEGMYACRLELDINTSPKGVDPLDRAILSPIFEILMELGKEIAEKGDIK